jgi:hypothetical protein
VDRLDESLSDVSAPVLRLDPHREDQGIVGRPTSREDEADRSLGHLRDEPRSPVALARRARL